MVTSGSKPKTLHECLTVIWSTISRIILDVGSDVTAIGLGAGFYLLMKNLRFYQKQIREIAQAEHSIDRRACAI